MVAVNPDILIWARETAALDLEEAAKKLGFRDSKTRTAVEKLESLESGQGEPTQTQLNKMSKAYYQPPLVFYLSKPPRRGDRGEDFRTLYQKNSDRKGNAHLNLLMRDIKAAQNLIRDVLEEEQAEPLAFINSATLSMGVEAVAKSIAKTLRFDLETFRAERKVRDAFAYLRETIESQNIFVLLLSDLGSHHTTIPVEIFRGFTYADDLAPFIVINRQDAVSAWSFTALHEVAHLWLGASGVSGPWGGKQIERFCDRVAGAILFPPHERAALALEQHRGFEWAADLISTAAEKMNVSRTMVSYNLMLDGIIDKTLWERLRDQFALERIQRAKQERESRKTQSGGPSYYTVRRHQLGNALVDLARYSLNARALTPSKAAVVLGVAPRNVYRLLFPDLA